MPAEVLIVDDDAPTRRMLRLFIKEIGYEVREAESGEQGLQLYEERRPDLVLLDYNMPGLNGLHVLQRMKRLDASCKIVMMSSYDTASNVVEAMQMGAETYLTKPMPLPELRILLESLLEKPAGDEPADMTEVGLLGTSSVMQEVFRQVRRVAHSHATVLITGPSGTGKDVVARAIHQLSPVAERSFIEVDCTDIPHELLEARIFGEGKADEATRTRGLLEEADWGTLYLNGIGLVPLGLQAKLLHLLESYRFRQVGGDRDLTAKVRVLASTSEDLEEAVREGRFREDLYYRLNVVPLTLPPLRERGEDATLIAQQLIEDHNRRAEGPPRQLGDDTLALLRVYPWPGNVRELTNVVERALLMSDDRLIHADDLIINRRSGRARPAAQAAEEGLHVDASGRISIAFPPEGLPLEQVERQVITAALDHTKGNVTRAAALLHVSRDTLRYRLDKMGEEAPKKRRRRARGDDA